MGLFFSGILRHVKSEDAAPLELEKSNFWGATTETKGEGNGHV